jgi:hypothetical protein
VCWGKKKDKARGFPFPNLAWDVWDSFPWGSGALATHIEGSFGFSMFAPWGMNHGGWRVSRLLSQRHMRENGAWMPKSGKCAGQNCTCDACNLEM